MKPPEFFNYQHVGVRILGLIAVAVFAWFAVLLSAIASPEQFAFAYFFAWMFFFTIGAGALFWTLVHHATRAEWSVIVRRQLENLAGLLLILAVLSVPFVLSGHWLWREAAWLFWAKTSACLLVFAGVASLLRALSIAQDADGSPGRLAFCRRVAFVSAVPFALCLTFSGFDWIMSLQPGWYSTVLGIYIFAGSALCAMSLLVVIVATLQRVGHLRAVVTPEHYHIMGKLLFVFTIFWGYIAFSQYLLIWYANIPEETSWFAVRGHGFWRSWGILLVIGQFVVPFILLLPAATKRAPRLLCGIALWVLGMHLLDVAFLILPTSPGRGIVIFFQSAFCLLAIGCTLAVVFLKWIGDSALYPPRDPRLPKSLALKN